MTAMLVPPTVDHEWREASFTSLAQQASDSASVDWGSVCIQGQGTTRLPDYGHVVM